MSNALLPALKDQDRTLQADVFMRLHATGFAALRSIDCRVRNGVVELSGDVPSFYCKQIAQSVVLPLEQVRGIRNHLRVL
jgi:hypothetical protein